MPRLSSALPKYRKHKGSGQARVRIDGQDFYLGPYRSKASYAEYDRLIAEYIANGRRVPGVTENRVTITELIAAYWRFAKGYYVKNGQPTVTFGGIRDALRPLKRLYGQTFAADFGPLALKAIKQHMIDSDLARDSGPVEPVAEDDFQATLPHLPGIVGDMSIIQRLTGCRPGEVCILRPCDIDRSNDVWICRPASHKTEHHGRERIIFIGPKVQDILRPYLLRPAESYCFSPAEAVEQRRRERHANRKTPMSCGNRPGTNRRRKPKRTAGDRYTTESYRQAIHRACDKAGVPQWSPNQLRHSAATEIRGKYGLEAAQVILGHAKADVTQVYAARDAELGLRVAREIG